MARLVPFLVLWLSSGIAWAAGGSPFPYTMVLGWDRSGGLATLTVTDLGRGMVELHGKPPRSIPVKSAGLCGTRPRWSCRMKSDPSHPEVPSDGWVAKVRRALGLVAPRPKGERLVPGSTWTLTLEQEAEGTNPAVELKLTSMDLGFMVWQPILRLDPDSPLEVFWHPTLPKGAILARSAASPYPRVWLVAEPDLLDPAGTEARALSTLAAQLRGRPSTSVKLTPVVERLRTRSQRRVELGAILAGVVGDVCPDQRDVVVLDALSFGWTDLERGAYLIYGCVPKGGDGYDLLVSEAIFRRARGTWHMEHGFEASRHGSPVMRLVDLTGDELPEVMVDSPGESGHRLTVLGWRESSVRPLVTAEFEPRCRQGKQGGSIQETLSVMGPDSKGRHWLEIRRRLFDSESCSGEPKEVQTRSWRWNSRLKRFYERSSSPKGPGLGSTPIAGPGDTSPDTTLQ